MLLTLFVSLNIKNIINIKYHNILWITAIESIAIKYSNKYFIENNIIIYKNMEMDHIFINH